ncbi:hypothetical protein AB0E04_17210 [Streptomyces sp. NPDC048251]|uniref:hypothetical protein n=1 Tax=Streptomyces sp. NPDC048251 TaxID=3154501 RepID=UPI00341C03D2
MPRQTVLPGHRPGGQLPFTSSLLLYRAGIAMHSFAVPAPVARSALMRASDALATQTATYAIPLLILVTTGSTALTGAAFLLEWLPRLTAFPIGGPRVDRFRTDRVFRTATLARTLLCAAAGVALAVLPAAGTASTVVVMTVGAAGGLPTLLLVCAVLQSLAMALAFRGLWRHRASYAPRRRALSPAASAAPAPNEAAAPRAA